MSREKILSSCTMKGYTHLGSEQRYKIEALYNAGHTITYISASIGVHKSSISRELKRNSQQRSKSVVYVGSFAQILSTKRQQIKPHRKKVSSQIERRIVWLLKRFWSPEQISKVCSERAVEMLSVEGIYQWIYAQKIVKQDYTCFLRRRRRKRRKRRLEKHSRGSKATKISIEERPKEIEERARLGDFEVDLAKCKEGYLVVATDRKSNFNLIKKVPDKTAKTVEEAIKELFDNVDTKPLSLTSDNGTEFANHQQIAQYYGIVWYFAHPHAPYERGTNENQIGLIRQFFTSKTDLSTVSDKEVQSVQNQLNARPRKKLNWESPKKQFENEKNYSNVALAN
jgi:transposase, IS30 family